MKLIWIVKAEYINEYKIKLEFNNSVKGVVDLKNLLNGPIFESLKEVQNFKNFKLNSWTIEWPNGADFAPEFLYELATKNQLEPIQ
jgi:hypothetical protein